MDANGGVIQVFWKWTPAGIRRQRPCREDPREDSGGESTEDGSQALQREPRKLLTCIPDLRVKQGADQTQRREEPSGCRAGVEKFCSPDTGENEAP